MMRAWHKQIVKDTVKATIPGKQRLRQLMRRILPYQTDPGLDSCLLDNAIRQIELVRDFGFGIRGRRVLEIGTGWHPIPAMAFLAAGAEGVTLTDIELLLDRRLLRSAIDVVLARRAELDRLGASSFDRIIGIEDDDLAAMLKKLGLIYLAPYRTTLSSDGS